MSFDRARSLSRRALVLLDVEKAASDWEVPAYGIPSTGWCAKTAETPPNLVSRGSVYSWYPVVPTF